MIVCCCVLKCFVEIPFMYDSPRGDHHASTFFTVMKAIIPSGRLQLVHCFRGKQGKIKSTVFFSGEVKDFT